MSVTYVSRCYRGRTNTTNAGTPKLLSQTDAQAVVAAEPAAAPDPSGAFS